MIMIHDSHMLSVTVPRQPVAVRLIKVIIRRELGTGCNPARYSHVRQDQESGPRNQASGIKNQELRIRNQEVSGDPGCGMLEAVRRRRLGEREKARKGKTENCRVRVRVSAISALTAISTSSPNQY